MSKKPLGKDKFGVQKVMRVKDYFGDATGQFALNAMSTLVGQLTYFYTDKVGMAAGQSRGNRCRRHRRRDCARHAY